MKPGNAINIGPYQFFFIDTQGTAGSNDCGIRAAFEVPKTRHVTNMYPENHLYRTRDDHD